MSHSKLYIAVLDTVPDNMVPVLVAHAMLTAHLAFYGEHAAYSDWLNYSFRKVVLKVNQKEFNKILLEDAVSVSHENSTLGGADSCIVVSPREDHCSVIKFAKMWAPAVKAVISRVPPKPIFDYHYDV
jgi:hypothetical protein